ncbi:MAG: glycosyltransferase [Atopobiaceae bacterium]|nr:glycosyltransferase [Atopobiaceae bacterium]
MNPVIVIPSYWSRTDDPVAVGDVGIYDHSTPISKPLPELETCLQSLEQVRGVLRVVVLVVAPPAFAESARARVDGICRMHPSLNPLVVGRREAQEVIRLVTKVAPNLDGEPCSLRGYGAIRNMGLAVAAALGHDVVVFLDDDEVVLDENFLIDAVYGIGLETRQGLPIQAKSGYYLDRDDSPYASTDKPVWYDRWWSKRKEFNEWMTRALSGTRISRSNYVCGGCFAVGAEAFCSVAFDPLITRGEDFDYLLNLRMYGFDVWFDNQWKVRHLPPEVPSHAARFLQNVYRWNYEVKKLEASHDIISLRHVTPESLQPYPANWLNEDILRKRIFRTALARTIVSDEHKEYFEVLVHGRREAERWAASVARDYFAFQTYWPRIMASLWEDKTLARALKLLGSPKPAKSRTHRAEVGSLDDSLPLPKIVDDAIPKVEDDD